MELIAHQLSKLKEQAARLPIIVRAPHRRLQPRHFFGVEVANIHPSRDKQVDANPKQQGRDKSQNQPQNAFRFPGTHGFTAADSALPRTAATTVYLVHANSSVSNY